MNIDLWKHFEGAEMALLLYFSPMLKSGSADAKAAWKAFERSVLKVLESKSLKMIYKAEENAFNTFERIGMSRKEEFPAMGSSTKSGLMSVSLGSSLCLENNN